MQLLAWAISFAGCGVSENRPTQSSPSLCLDVFAMSKHSVFLATQDELWPIFYDFHLISGQRRTRPDSDFREGRLIGLAAGHASDHRAEGNQMDKHQGLVIPQCPNGKPAQNPNQKQVEVPGGPAKSGRCIPHDLHRGCRPFDRKYETFTRGIQGSGIRRHASALHRCGDFDLSYSHHLLKRAMR